MPAPQATFSADVPILIQYGRETMAYFSKKKKKRKRTTRGICSMKKRRKNLTQRIPLYFFSSNFTVCIAILKPLKTSQTVIEWLIYKPPLMLFFIKLLTNVFYISIYLCRYYSCNNTASSKHWSYTKRY